MHLKFETKELDNILSKISKIIPSASYVRFVGSNKKVRVMTSHDGFNVSVELPCQLMQEGKFAVVFDDVKKLFRNRKEIEMKLSDKGNKVMFKAGSSKDFSGDIVTQETHSIKFHSSENISLTEEQAEFICSSVPLLALEDVYFKKPLSITVYFSDKGGYCFVRSDFHVGVSRVKGEFKKAMLTMPLKNFTGITSLAEDGKFSIAVNENSIYATGSTFDISFPLEAQEDSNAKKIFKIVESVVSTDEVAIIDMQELKQSMDNVVALNDGKASMAVSISKKDGISLSLSALRGSVKAALKNAKVKKDVSSFDVSPQMLSNILKNAKKGEFSMRTNERLFSLSSNFKIKAGKVSYHYVGTFFE